ncbi:MAG TPA: trehalose-phosphatase [Acidimicrobiales bacterium]
MGAGGAEQLPAALLPLVHAPADSALFLDFDGTLSAIVREPLAARPLPGVPELLTNLSRRLALVAVISGRAENFLAQVLDHPRGVELYGLYGLELVVAERGDGDDWSAVITRVAAAAQAGAPAGVFVEPKVLTLTLHWRNAPEGEPWVRAFAAEQTDLVVIGARSSLELRPPIDVDKGTVIRTRLSRLTRPPRAVAVFGDDVGDLPAFAAAAALAAEGVKVARVAAVDEETPPEVASQADVVVEGAAGAVALLQALAQTLS